MIPRKKVTLNALRSLYKKGEPLTMITAHDFPSGHVGDAAGMEMVLVGDSLAMVALGLDDTSEVLVEEMLLHCRSVARAAKSAFTVRDLPRPRTMLKLTTNTDWRSAYGLLRDLSGTSLRDRNQIYKGGACPKYQVGRRC